VNVTHEAGDPYLDDNASWTDYIDGSGILFAEGEVNASKPGVYLLSYNYADSSGNEAVGKTRSVTVVDTTAPVVALNGEADTIHEAGDSYSELGALWTDIVDGNGTADVNGTVDIYAPGIYTISYSYTDHAGNVAVKRTRTVEVRDTIAPVITLHGDENVSLFVWQDYIELGVIAHDSLDGNLTQAVERVGEVDTALPGKYELIYRVRDANGNEAVPVSRFVEVVNRAPNLLTLSNDQILENGQAGEWVGLFTANDPDDLNGEKVYTYEMITDANTSGGDWMLDSNGTLMIAGALDFEEQELYSLKVRVRDEFGGSYEDEFEVSVVDVHRPIVDTLGIIEYENGGYDIGGQLVDDGGRRESLSYGVLVSDRPILGRDQAGVNDFTLQLDQATQSFRRFYGPDPSWKKMYVRAYAYNEEGISYGLEERTVLTPVARTRDAWSGATRIDGTPGWWQSEWFGVYFKSEQSGWILHTELGWLYPSPSTHQGIWMWKEGVGWLWSDEGVYPYIYSESSGGWLYFFGQSKQQRLLFDYGLGKWLRLDEFGVLETEGAR